MPLIIDTLISEGLVEKKNSKTAIRTTTMSASTDQLTVDSEGSQVYTGTVTGQVVKMPDATTLSAGYEYSFANEGSANVSVQDFSSGALFLLGANQRAFVTLRAAGSAAGTWMFSVQDKFSSGLTQFTVTSPGTGLVVNYTGGNVRFNGVFTAVASGSITLPASTTGIVYVDIDAVVKATVSLPDNAVPLYTFTTSATAVTALADVREDIAENTKWGLTADIQPVRYNSVAGSGTQEKSARADHTHANTGLLTKSGSIAAATFTGTPRVASVVFAAAFPSANYAVNVLGQDGRSWKVTVQSTTGFTVSSQANTALTGPVAWTAVLNGESL
jgi:hypothetical protein